MKNKGFKIVVVVVIIVLAIGACVFGAKALLGRMDKTDSTELPTEEITSEYVISTTVPEESSSVVEESMPVYESLADATNAIDRISNELAIVSNDVAFQLQTFVDAIQPDSLESEYITEDMLNVRHGGEYDTVYISGYDIPGFDKEEILLFDVYPDGHYEDYEDWAVLDYYLYTLQNPVETDKYTEEPTEDYFANEYRSTGTVNQSSEKVQFEGYTAIDSKVFDNDDYCDTELPYTAYMNKFNSLIDENLDRITVTVMDPYAASLDLWNFVNAYVIPLTQDKYEIKIVDIFGDYGYNVIRISGSPSDKEVGTYGKYIMVIHEEDYVVYSDFYIWNE